MKWKYNVFQKVSFLYVHWWDTTVAAVLRSSHYSGSSVEHTGLVRGNHVFDVYEGILTSLSLKCFKSLLYQITNILSLLLAIVNTISRVHYCKNINIIYIYIYIYIKLPEFKLLLWLTISMKRWIFSVIYSLPKGTNYI